LGTMRYIRRHVLILAAIAVVGTISACAPTENTLATHLGTPLESFPGIVDDVYTLSLTQDDRLGSLPREANQVLPTEEGWVIVAICADTSSINPETTHDVILRVVAAEFVDPSTQAQIERGEFQDGVVCGNAASTGPDLKDG